jgi:RHS repeat-associated protein
VSLPQGGGAIRSIGEKFTVNAATGTASLAVPVATSPGRAGFGPSLSLTYDSGSGNGPFGHGWTVSLPAITRKTDKGLPRYLDHPDQDTFILSGAEDLVPIREERDGTWVPVPQRRSVSGRQYEIQRYRPRVEGLFARIERWRDLASGEMHWRSISSGNITTIYGASPRSRIADPGDPARVFSWLICESYDDTGNAIVYDYATEDSAGVQAELASERNRTALSRSAGRYPKRIKYGNRTPWPAATSTSSEDPPAGTADSEHDTELGSQGSGDWMFEVVFDYGDHDEHAPQPEPTRAWLCRSDPFSTYRPGFEIRTYRRCHRVLMFHHFPAEPGVGASCLVRSTDLTYREAGGAGMTTVASVTQTGYRRRFGGYRAESLPPLEFCYSEAVIGHEPRDLDPDALQNLPTGIGGTAYQWVDLDGEGLSGVLARQGGAWFYKANLGNGRFAPERTLTAQPAMAGTSGQGQQQLLDLAGDGHLDLAELGRPMAGFYERTSERGWRPFRPFPSQPNISWDDPELRMVDLDGDGLADVLITGDDAFTWYPSLGHQGFGPARRAYHPWGEEHGPRVMLADPEQTIYLADMSGDGLSDLVRVRNREVCYWPNLGFGRFGAKVTMDGCPWLDKPGRFDQRRVRLADVDGTGTADLVYLHPDGTQLYLNHSGNGFGQPQTLPHAFPRLDSLAQVMVADLLGRGTGCLVWSSPLPGDAGRQIRYLDLMAAGKPYLLTDVINNLGAETRISYAPSTRFYLEDQAAGRPWITRLPFAVHVVERVETIDQINHNKFTTRHAYHHGYYDGFEREFRGFGMVETWDTEELAVLEADGTGGHFANLDPATDLPPMLTRTWLHTGVFPAENRVTRLYAHEYYRQPGGGGPDLPGTALPTTLRLTGQALRPWRLSRNEAREACRALKGKALREEVYALDGTEAQSRPYAVTEHNYTIELLQPGTEPQPDGPQNYHAVFLTHSRESVTANYERTLYPVDGELRADPRITHDLVLALDDYGNPVRSASAGYGRRYPDPTLTPEDQAAQARLRLTYTENGYTNAVDLPDAHRTPMPAQASTFEVVGLSPARRLFDFTELWDGMADVITEISFQGWDADVGAPARRLISRTRIRYRRDDLSGALPLGVLEPLALPYRSYRQAFTDSLVVDLYGNHVDAKMLTAAGYIRDGESWQLPSGRVFYSPGDADNAGDELAYARRNFFLPHRFRDPFGNTTAVSYDRYGLLVAETRDPLGNVIAVGERDASGRFTTNGNDYRVLAPRLVSDPNRNRAAVAFDTLGRVGGTAVMGKPGEHLGDSLDGFEPDPEPAVIAGYFADPFADAHDLLGRATTRVLYDVDAYRRTRHSPQPQPAVVAVLARETHVSDLAPGQSTKIQCALGYSDGFGQVVQHKTQAAPGPVTDGGPEIERRWVGSGWTVFNNKGKPVRSYEPFFTATPSFEFASAVGVSSVLFYDPVGRVVATLHPDDSYDKTVFDPWHQATWDGNDTVLLNPSDDPDVAGYAGRYLAVLSQRPGGWTTWYAQRVGGALGPAEHRAAAQTVPHANTPARAWLDTLGRTFLTVAHNRVTAEGHNLADQFCRTRSRLDIQGNVHEVRDALGRALMRYSYTMTSAQVAHDGMDTGGGMLLSDVTGKLVYSQNSRGFVFRTDYDALRRPINTYVAGPGITGQAQQTRTEYGESVADGEASNLRTRVVAQYDGVGLINNEAYDFKGNLLQASRKLAAIYRDVIDWAKQIPLEERDYPSRTSYDALNRATSMTSPDGSVLSPSYNQASQLDRMDGRLRGAAETTTFIAHIDYNARGQRTLVSHGNGSVCTYNYNPLTFRLVGLTTLRGAERLQDLRYTCDPVGNPVLIRDHAQQTIFFRNRVVDPTACYTYDALYRLIEATGREHLSQVANGTRRSVAGSANDPAQISLPQPGDGTAMARYTEHYVYDEVGNLLRMAHRSADQTYGGWTRDYRYHQPSLLEPARHSNRLTGTGPARAVTKPQQFSYDEQGNITAMPEIPVLHWDEHDRLHATARQAADGHTVPETTYYVYDGPGQRARKVTERRGNTDRTSGKSERIYVGPFEVYRQYDAHGAVTLERETLSVLDDKQRIALVETRTAGTDRGPHELIRYQLINHLGSSVLELDQNARIISYEEYCPYGSTSYQAVRSRTETPKRYRYTGKERDEESGLYYYGARYYAPWLGRWTSPDPAGIAGAPNLYVYARNSPVRFGDPNGAEDADFWKVDDRKTTSDRALDVAGLWIPAIPVARGLYATVTGQVSTDYLVPGLGSLAIITDETPRMGYKAAETVDHVLHGDWGAAVKSGIDTLAHGQNVGFALLPFLTEAARKPPTSPKAPAPSTPSAPNPVMDAEKAPAPPAADTPQPADPPSAANKDAPEKTQAPADTAGTVESMPTTVAAEMFRLRDQAVQEAYARVQADPQLAKTMTPMKFGNLVDEIFKEKVVESIAQNQLPSTMRVTATSNKGVAYGIDVYDTATGEGYDVHPANSRQVLKHMDTYEGKTMPEGTKITNVNPLVYESPWKKPK